MSERTIPLGCRALARTDAGGAPFELGNGQLLALGVVEAVLLVGLALQARHALLQAALARGGLGCAQRHPVEVSAQRVHLPPQQPLLLHSSTVDADGLS